MIIYYGLFFILEFTLLGLGSRIRSRVLSIAAVILAISFCGLRYETGYDYDAYRSFFEDLWTYEGLIEPGFFYLVHLANTIAVPTFALFFLFSLVTHGLAYYTLAKVSISPNLAFLFYLLIPGLYLNSFSIIRSAFAVSIFSYAAFRLISRGAQLEYLALAVLAISFHFTAVLPFFVAFALFRSKMGMPSRLTCVLLLLSGLIVSQLGVVETLLGIFGGTKYESYAIEQEAQSPLKVVASNLLALFIIFHRNYFGQTKALAYFFNIWLGGTILYNGLVQFSAVTRISYYFSFFSIPLLIYATSIYKEKVAFLTRAALILFVSSAFAVAMYNDMQVEDPLNLSNYKTIFEAP